MAGVSFNDEANAAKLYRILIGKGTEILREMFDKNCPPFELPEVLQRKKYSVIKRLQKKSIVNRDEWNLLYPASGDSDSKKFDFRLLSVLLEHICGLKPQETKWYEMPNDTDRSQKANLVRIKLYIQWLTHLPQFGVSTRKFKDLWPKISKALFELGVSETEIGE
jgi:hypothetical protein